MKILLDTHAIIWALTGDNRLGTQAKKLLLCPQNSVHFSIVSIWEIAIKNQKAPEKCPYNEQAIYNFCIDSGFEPLGLLPEHIYTTRCLKTKSGCALSNTDLFDRILISQAKAEGMQILSADSNFKNYDEACIITI